MLQNITAFAFTKKSEMDRNPKSRDALFWIAIFAIAKLVFHTIVNQQYGFHRDELQTLDDARHLAFGYVVYPPLTPFIGRIALELFGESLAGFRFFAAAAQSVAIVLAASILPGYVEVLSLDVSGLSKALPKRCEQRYELIGHRLVHEDAYPPDTPCWLLRLDAGRSREKQQKNDGREPTHSRCHTDRPRDGLPACREPQ